MSYVIRSQHDNRSMLALPEAPGKAVRWVDPIEGIVPWVFETKAGATRARDMQAYGAHVEPMKAVTV